MTEDDQTTGDLERLGAQPGPPMDAAFANRLEADLRLLIAAPAEHAARPWWQPALVVATSVLFLVGGLAALRSVAGDPSAELVMSAAADTEVILPGSNPADGRAGLELPEGTRILVGANGQAVVAGVVLAPGSEAVIVGGRLEVITISSTTSTMSDSTSTARATSTSEAGAASSPTATTTRSHGSNGSTTAEVADRSTTSASTASTDRTTTSTTVGRSDQTASTTSPTSPPSTAGDAVPTRPTTTAVPSSTERTTIEATRPTQTTATDRSIELSVEAESETRLRLTWSLAGDGPQVLGFEVQVLLGRRIRTVLVLRDPGASTATVEMQDGQIGYRVRAIGGDGVVLATSDAIRRP